MNSRGGMQQITFNCKYKGVDTIQKHNEKGKNSEINTGSVKM